jgi:hypothetical protein
LRVARRRRREHQGGHGAASGQIDAACGFAQRDEIDVILWQVPRSTPHMVPHVPRRTKRVFASFRSAKSTGRRPTPKNAQSRFDSTMRNLQESCLDGEIGAP